MDSNAMLIQTPPPPFFERISQPMTSPFHNSSLLSGQDQSVFGVGVD